MLTSTSKISFFWMASLAVLLAAAPAQAGVIVYDDPLAWEADVAGYSTIDFEGITDPGTVAGFGSGLTIDGVTFYGALSSTAGMLDVINPLDGWGSDFDSGAVLSGPSYSSDAYEQAIVVDLPPGTTAFAVDLMSLDPGGLSFKIVLSIGDIIMPITTALKPTKTFFGITSDVPIDSISFIIYLDPGNTAIPTAISHALLDNFKFGLAAAAGPDPGAETIELATFFYVGTGVLMLVLTKRNWDRPA